MAEAQERDRLAEERTALAEDRTILANERTFAGWMRTGLAAIGIGVAFNALFQSMERRWVPKAIATVLLAISIFITFSAERRARAVMARLKPHEVEEMNLVNLKLISWALIAAAVALTAPIWILGGSGRPAGGGPV